MGIIYTTLFKRGVFLGASMLYRLSNRQKNEETAWIYRGQNGERIADPEYKSSVKYGIH